jgi:hypothetical protein
MSWTALTRDELEAMLSSALSQYDQDVGSDWERIRIRPEKWQCSPWGDLGEGFWAVAINDGNVLWYNDIEDGFNWSRYSKRGVIDDYWCNQDEFEEILERFAKERSERTWRSLKEEDVPEVLKRPGRIRQRQTTYWQLEPLNTASLRVHFRDKVEYWFAGDDYLEVLLLDAHPLLTDYSEPTKELFIAGTTFNPTRLANQLDEHIRTQTDGWRTLAAYETMDAVELLAGGHGLLLRAPESICSSTAALRLHLLVDNDSRRRFAFANLAALCLPLPIGSPGTASEPLAHCFDPQRKHVDSPVLVLRRNVLRANEALPCRVPRHGQLARTIFDALDDFVRDAVVNIYAWGSDFFLSHLV